MSPRRRPSAIGTTGGPAAARFVTPTVAVPDRLVEDLEGDGIPCRRDEDALAEAARDWWPLSLGWAKRGLVPHEPAVVARPTEVTQVASLLARCAEAQVPVTPTAGGSGVCGGSIPAFGGVSLDMTGLSGLRDLDGDSLLVDVAAGTFGPDVEAALGEAGFTLGHWPQSMDISTVGGWVACRGAGQYSTRYGKIEDLVEGLEVVLADGTVLWTEGAAPRAATGPSLTQLFLGSEGTLGVVTAARLRITPTPATQARLARRFATFADGLDACRRILRRGATPAVLRLYDEAESRRHFDESGCVLILYDEAERDLVEATVAVCDRECATAEPLGEDLVARWLYERNDTAALGPLWGADIVVDTIEVAGRWAALPALAEEMVRAIHGIEGTIAASVHQSHAYRTGACLYFTFAGRHPGEGEPDEAVVGPWLEAYYREVWDVAMACVLRHHAAVSHHHGIGINRSRFMADALGPGLAVLQAVKDALDPRGILNPGKLGLRSPFGASPWP